MEKKSDYLVIIPAYNEAETIEELVLRVKKYADVCVINDNSNDATPEILGQFPDIHVIHHEKNTHIPSGLLDGMRYAVSKGYAYGIAIDAGLSHNPDEIPRFIDHPHSDLAIGTRIEKTNTPFCPPKPKEFEIAASILTARGSLPMTSSEHSGSGVS